MLGAHTETTFVPGIGAAHEDFTAHKEVDEWLQIHLPSTANQAHT